MQTRSTRDSAVSAGNRKRSVARQVMIECGVAAALVYAATDLIGGLLHPGYSFGSQMVSELMAVGAPSERIVDPLFLLFGLLVIAFGVGVFREGLGGNRRLRIAGALLVAYGAVGLTGPTLFEMHPRGSATATSDTPHIVLTAALVLLTLAAMGFAAFALGKRFRIYSLLTLAAVVVFGAAAAPSGARLAAGEPTPGFGILERINIYASMLWLVVLSVALLKRPSVPGGRVRE